MTESKDLGFSFVWMDWFGKVLGSAGPKGLVIAELLIRMDTRDNTFNGPARDIGHQAGVSHSVVLDVLKRLEKEDLIRKTSGGRYMISPLAFLKGSTRKRGMLMKKYIALGGEPYVLQPNTDFNTDF